MFIWTEQKSKLQQGRRIKTKSRRKKEENVTSAQLNLSAIVKTNNISFRVRSNDLALSVCFLKKLLLWYKITVDRFWVSGWLYPVREFSQIKQNHRETNSERKSIKSRHMKGKQTQSERLKYRDSRQWRFENTIVSLWLFWIALLSSFTLSSAHTARSF